MVDDKNNIMKEITTHRAYQYDGQIISCLIAEERLKEEFIHVREISGHPIPQFRMRKFVHFINYSNHGGNGFTKFGTKIGLAIDGRQIHKNSKPQDQEIVELQWPFKDCVLEGGQGHEDIKRNEIFFNQELSRDEITKLFEEKVFTNALRYTTEGVCEVDDFTRDAEMNTKRGLPEETICDNLFIRGNNLLSMHSIAKEFEECVKLIFIDPPYNTGSDSFKYNDAFNEASWLTFMHNRLSIAHNLLSDDGGMFVQIDHHQLGTLLSIMDEIFGNKNRVSIITVKASSTGGFKGQNPGPTEVTEYILFYVKDAESAKSKLTTEWDFTVELENPMSTTGVNNYDMIIDNIEKDPEDWVLRKIKPLLMDMHGFKNWNEFKKEHKDSSDLTYNQIRKQFMLEYKDRIVSKRDPAKPGDNLKALLRNSRDTPDKIHVLEKDGGGYHYAYNGGLLAFFGKTKVREIDGKATIVDQLTNLWTHISWAGIASEGGVTLKNGKKPEKLLQQIIEIWTDQGEIVMDYHLGSGTTAAVAHKMGRQYIGMEQLDYAENDPYVRLQNVVNGDDTGVSKSVGWEGGGDFVYLELKKYNGEFSERIGCAESNEVLLAIWEEIKKKAFFHYSVDLMKFEENLDFFQKLSLDEQKATLVQLLDSNHMYVNLSSLDDTSFECSDDEKAITKKFYRID